MLIVRYSVELTAAHFGISVEKVNELLASARAKMAEVRKSRPRPHLDNKMLASWNGNVCKRIQSSNTPHMRKLKWSICAGGCLIIRGCSIGVRFETTKMWKMDIICDFFLKTQLANKMVTGCVLGKVWSLLVLPVTEWVLIRYPRFPPQSKNMNVR